MSVVFPDPLRPVTTSRPPRSTRTRPLAGHAGARTASHVARTNHLENATSSRLTASVTSTTQCCTRSPRGPIISKPLRLKENTQPDGAPSNAGAVEPTARFAWIRPQGLKTRPNQRCPPRNTRSFPSLGTQLAPPLAASSPSFDDVVSLLGRRRRARPARTVSARGRRLHRDLRRQGRDPPAQAVAVEVERRRRAVGAARKRSAAVRMHIAVDRHDGLRDLDRRAGYVQPSNQPKSAGVCQSGQVLVSNTSRGSRLKWGRFELRVHLPARCSRQLFEIARPRPRTVWLT